MAHELQHHIKSYIGISARIEVVEIGRHRATSDRRASGG